MSLNFTILLKWLGTALQAGGAAWLATNVRTSPRAFLAMLSGAVIWAFIAAYQQDYALMAMQLVFCAINIVGIVRWWK